MLYAQLCKLRNGKTLINFEKPKKQSFSKHLCLCRLVGCDTLLETI